MTAQTFQHNAAGCYPMRVDVLCTDRACWWAVKLTTGETVESAETNYQSADAAINGAVSWLDGAWAHTARALASPIVWPAI